MPEEIKFNEEECKDGHNLVKIVSFNNGRSAWGEMICQKCGRTYSWQYDYNPYAGHVHETKPF